jgi:hypothetical protein
MKREVLDTIVNKLISRKLMVFMVSVVALFNGNITGDNWIVVSTAYIGTEAVIDAVVRLKQIKEEQNG